MEEDTSVHFRPAEPPVPVGYAGGDEQEAGIKTGLDSGEIWTRDLTLQGNLGTSSDL